MPRWVWVLIGIAALLVVLYLVGTRGAALLAYRAARPCDSESVGYRRSSFATYALSCVSR
jgi:hypothetical protein